MAARRTAGTTPAALYHLSLAYALNRDLDRARALALQLARGAELSRSERLDDDAGDGAAVAAHEPCPKVDLR